MLNKENIFTLTSRGSLEKLMVKPNQLFLKEFKVMDQALNVLERLLQQLHFTLPQVEFLNKYAYYNNSIEYIIQHRVNYNIKQKKNKTKKYKT